MIDCKASEIFVCQGYKSTNQGGFLDDYPDFVGSPVAVDLLDHLADFGSFVVADPLVLGAGCVALGSVEHVGTVRRLHSLS